MRQIQTSAVLAVALVIAGNARAADLPDRRAAPPPPPAARFTWTGLFVGVNAGYRFGGSALRFSGTDNGTAGFGSALAAGAIPLVGARQPGGFLGGGGIGYNQQINDYVVGLEADVDGTTGRRSVNSLSALPTFVPLLSSSSQTLGYLGTARARLGWAGVDRLLIFVTGGFAFGDARTSFQELAPAAVPRLAAATATRRSIGYAVGAGVEYAFAPHLSARVEYLHYDLGTTAGTVSYAYVSGGAHTSTLTGRARQDGDLVRGGLIYRFGESPVVVARY